MDGHVERFGVPIKACVVIQAAPPVTSVSFLTRLLKAFSSHRTHEPPRVVLFDQPLDFWGKLLVILFVESFGNMHD